MKWSKQNILKLIKLYKQFECLWNCKCQSYKRLESRGNAWQQISDQMKVDMVEVKKKIKGLRSAYVAEKHKVDSSKLSADCNYEPHLFYYSKLSFLDKFVFSRRTSSSLKAETEEYAMDALNDNSALVEHSSDKSLIDQSSSKIVNIESVKWSKRDILKAISLYRQFECLWNYRSQSYKRTDLKNNAWQQISHELKKDIAEVQTKIRSLRHSYIGEKTKLESSKKSGSSGDCNYEPLLFYYSEMCFLDKVVALPSARFSLKKEPLEFETEVLDVNPTLTENCSDTSIAKQSAPINVKIESMKWSKGDILKAIRLYRQFECLWNCRSYSYKRADLKNNAWQQISHELKKDIEEVQKKIRNLRHAYIGEKNKVESSKKSDSSADYNYEPLLFYYNEMAFLDEVLAWQRTRFSRNKKTLELVTEAFDVNPNFTDNSSDASLTKQFTPLSANIDNMKWSIGDILKLIQLYRQFECLWNYRSIKYKRMDIKNNAWQTISHEMEKDIEEIKKKIKNLRAAYVAEKKKVDSSKNSGLSPDCNYEPILFYYREMSFLDKVIVFRRIRSGETLEFETQAFDVNSTLTENSSDTTPAKQSTPVNSNIENLDWSTGDILKLINLYRQFEYLWNYRSHNYKRTELKDNAWQKISNEMKKDIGETKKKMKQLRAAYLAEKNKVDASQKLGSSADYIYEPYLFYYCEMSFLDKVVASRKPRGSLHAESWEDDNSTDNSSGTYLAKQSAPINCRLLPSSSPPVNSAPQPYCSLPTSSLSSLSDTREKSSKKFRSDAKFNSALDAIIASATTQEPENMFTSFGTTIALQLQQLPLIQATKTMSEIHNQITKKVLACLEASESVVGLSVHQS